MMSKNEDGKVLFEVLMPHEQLEQVNQYCERYGFESLSEMVNIFLINELDRREDLSPGDKQIAYLKTITDGLYKEYEAGKLMKKILKEVMLIKEYVIAVHGEDKNKLKSAREKAEKAYINHLRGKEIKTPWDFEDDEDPDIEMNLTEREEYKE